MVDEEELRARIAARIASRQAEPATPGPADSQPSQPPEHPNGPDAGTENDPGPAESDETPPAVTRYLEPVRPWLAGKAGTGSATEAPAADARTTSGGTADPADPQANSRTLDPVRPWQLRERAQPADDPSPSAPSAPSDTEAAAPTTPSSPSETASSHPLQPVRPWLHQRTPAPPAPPRSVPNEPPNLGQPGPPRTERPESRRFPSARPIVTPRPAEPPPVEPPPVEPPPAEPPSRAASHAAERSAAKRHWRRHRDETDDGESMADWLAPTGAEMHDPDATADPEAEPVSIAEPEPPRIADRATSTDDSPVEVGDDIRQGPLRRALDWLLEPAEASDPSDDAAASAEPIDMDEQTRVLPRLFEPVADEPPHAQAVETPARGPEEVPETVAEPAQAVAEAEEEPAVTPEPVAQASDATPSGATPSEATSSDATPSDGSRDAAEPMVLTPGADLARRLAAANAAAMARAHSAPPVEPEPAEHDPAPVEHDPAPVERAPTRSPLVTGAAFAQRTAVPDAGAEDDGRTPGGRTRSGRTLHRLLVATLVIAFAAAAALLLRTFVVAPYYIPSASMEPTLHGCSGCNNDHVLVNKLSYRVHGIHRGDVVVFHRPKTWQVSDKILIKRVIGLPGDVLTTRRGIVYVDGLQLEEPYLDANCKGGTVGLPAKSVKVAADTAFVMGDNRCDSSDSRRFGAIPDSSVIGRAFVTVWPLGRIHWL